MRKLLVAAAILSAVAVRPARAQTVIVGNLFTAPAANTVLVDSGTLDTSSNLQCPTGGLFRVEAYISSTVGTFFKIVVLNSGGAAVATLYRGVPATDSKDWQPNFPLAVPNGGKVQVQTAAAVASSQSVQASMGVSDPQGCY